MFRFVALFALVSCAFAGALPDDLDGRIVNGKATTIEQHPYQVSLQKSGSHFCGGSIVNQDTIVTAAHCVQGGTKAADIKVRLGSTYYKDGGELVSVRDLSFHPGYNSKTMVNDVAILKLATPVRESKTVKYIPLALKDPSNGTPAVVTGWGTTCYLLCSLTPELQEVEVSIISQATCASSEYKYGAQIEKTMICAYEEKKDACQGDSGGPLVANKELVGVVSWGNGCARAGYPGVYGDIAATRTWLDEEIKNL